MSKLKKILMIVFLFIPIMMFFPGCNCSGGKGNGNTDDTTYTVTFITNSPVTFNIGPYEVEAGKTIVEPKRPSTFESVYNADHEIDGYTYIYSFIGWFEDPEFNTPWTFTKPVNSNMTLYAKYDIRLK